MKFRKQHSNSSIIINITPLIDIVFILLIFFAVTTSFISSNSINVDLPKAKGYAVEKKKNIRIAVSNSGALYINGKAILDSELKEELSLLKNSSPDALIVIEADKQALHGKVVFVIDNARAMDFTRFAIATEGE